MAGWRWGTTAAKQIIIRFGFNSNVPGSSTYSIALRNGATNRSYVANFTVPLGGATDYEFVFVIPGDTTGTWPVDNSRGLTFTVQLATNVTPGYSEHLVGGNLQMTAANTNPFTGSNKTFQLFDLGLYVDPNLTGLPPPWEAPSDRQAMFDSQRYYQKCLNAVGAMASTTTPARASSMMQAPMRIAPASSFVGAMRGWDQATAPNLTAIQAQLSNRTVNELNFTASSAQTQGRAAFLIGRKSICLYRPRMRSGCDAIRSRQIQPIVMPFPDGARPVEAIDEQGAKWALTDNSELGDWLRYLEAGGTIDPMTSRCSSSRAQCGVRCASPGVMRHGHDHRF